MGAGILPITIYKGKLYLLFGKENKYEDTAPGYSDFGGGTDFKETYMETAIREGGEELTGFLGSNSDVKKMLSKYGTYDIDYKPPDYHSNYRTHLFPMKYDPYLPFYYNNNQRFLQKRLQASIIKKTKIFEKAHIKWFCVNDLIKDRKLFRFYFRHIIDMIYAQKNEILKFAKTSLKIQTKKNAKIYKHRKSRKN